MKVVINMQCEVGDIVLLNKNAFKKPRNDKPILDKKHHKRYDGYNCASTGHMFVVLRKICNFLICCIVSSKQQKINDQYVYNVPIDNWQTANLNKPSHVKLDRRTHKISENDVIKVVGHIDDADFYKISKVYRTINKDNILMIENLKLVDLLIKH